MNIYRKRKNLLTLTLLAINVAAAACLFFIMQSGDSDRPVHSSASEPNHAGAHRQEEATPAIAFTMAPLNYYRDIVNRSLFSPERHPPKPPENPAEVTKAAAASSFTLIGIAITPETTRALLLPAGQNEVFHASVGQQVQGWKVSEIHPDKVIVTRGTKQETLKLEPGTQKRASPRKAPKPPPFRLR